MTSRRGGPLALHNMQVCTVSFSDPDTAALADEVRSSAILAVHGESYLKDLAILEHPRRYALQRVFAVYSSAISQLNGDSWLSVDAGLDPTRFSVIFPDKKGKDVGTFEHRVSNFREALRADWFRTWAYNLRRRLVGVQPEAERAFYDLLFERMVSFSDFSEITTSWGELLETGKGAEAMLHREAYLYGLNSGLPSGLSCLEAGNWSRTVRIAALAPLSVRKVWEFRGHTHIETTHSLLQRGFGPLLTDLPTWAVVGSLESPLESFRDLLGRALERNWTGRTPEVEALLQKSRSAVFGGVDAKIARWCSPRVFGNVESGSIAIPKPSVLELFDKKDLSAESLYW